MNNFEKKVLIDKLIKPEISDGTVFGIAGLGTIIFGSSIGILPITLVTALSLAGPIMVSIGIGGTVYMITADLIKKKSLKKRA